MRFNRFPVKTPSSYRHIEVDHELVRDLTDEIVSSHGLSFVTTGLCGGDELKPATARIIASLAATVTGAEALLEQAIECAFMDLLSNY